MRSPFAHGFDDLPAVLPIFPLSGAIVLPRARLNLNIFEPRYLNMTLDALAADRLIGMIQPLPGAAGDAAPATFGTGCAGRISTFSETDDGRLLIILTGVCRFDIAGEIEMRRGYRRVAPDWTRFRDDLSPASDEDCVADRAEVRAALGPYVEARELQIDHEVLDRLSASELTDVLAMNLPFPVEDKQALLEAGTLPERARTLAALLRVCAAGNPPDGVRH